MLVPMRPSNEALLRARVPGAQDQRGCHSIPFIVGVLRARRAPGPSSLILPAAELLALTKYVIRALFFLSKIEACFLTVRRSYP